MQEKSVNKSKKVTLVQMRQTWFRTEDGQTVNLEESSPAEFDAFISQYLDIEDVDRSEWDLMTRWRAVNFALKNDLTLALCKPLEQVAEVKNG
jgi:hypothetical protein